MLDQPNLSTPVPGPPDPDPAILKQVLMIIDRSLARAIGWGKPPNWSLQEWRRELGQVASLAALEATRDRHLHSRILLGAFVYQRVISKVRTRSRNEWSFARAHQAGAHQCPEPEAAEPLSTALGPDQEVVHRELTLLVSALPAQKRNLVIRLYWHGSTEAREAKALGVTQSAISQRKEAILRELRQHFAMNAPGPARENNRTSNAIHQLNCKLTGRAYKKPSPRNTSYRKAVEGTPKGCRSRGNQANPQPPS